MMSRFRTLQSTDNPSISAGVTIGGSDIDARNGVLTDYQAGYFNSTVVHNVRARNMYFHGISASGGSFDIHDNYVKNVAGDLNSAGIEGDNGAGLISHNTVSDSIMGVYAQVSHGIQFLDNTVTRSAVGVRTDYANPLGGSDVMSGNSVSACT